MEAFRNIPDGVYRLPTILIDIDGIGGVNETNVLYFDEVKQQKVPNALIPFYFNEALLAHDIAVLPVSIQNGDIQHSNALIIRADTIERFEPRGDQTDTIKQVYIPQKLDTFFNLLIRRWSSDVIIRRKMGMIYRKPDSLYSTYQYFPPMPRGIPSNNKAHTNCARLTFSYLNIRTHVDFRDRSRQIAHARWLEMEKNRT
jgi:hypothetical protein